MPERYSPLRELTMARLREFVRETGAVFWTFGFPVLLALALGIAFRSQEPAPPVVAFPADSPAWLAQGLQESGELTALALAEEEALARLRTGAIDLYVRIESDAGEAAVYRYDGSREGALRARLVVDALLQRKQGRIDVLAARDEKVAEKGSRYVDFLFPGILGMNVMSSSMWGLGYTIVLMRERKQLKRLAATPMRRSHFLLAMFSSRLLFLALEVLFLLVFGSMAFGVAVRGSAWEIGTVALFGAASFAGIALAIAARVRSVEAVSGWLNLVMLPMWVLSGTFFTYERFPDLLQLPIRALPLTALNDSLRALVNEGRPLLGCSAELATLFLWAALGFGLAARGFRWQ
jgi:ABC-type multidrug transport system permease subunit